MQNINKHLFAFLSHYYKMMFSQILKLQLHGKVKCTLNCVNVINTFTRSVHIYKDITPWKSNSEFAQYLLQNILYHKNGLLVLNKPYGVTFSRDGNFVPKPPTVKVENVICHRDLNKTVIEKTVVSSGITNDELSLVKTLPYLKQALGVEKLYIAKVPEKYTSGVTILASDKGVVERIQKSVLRTRPGKEAMDTHHAIVIGKPRYTNNDVTLGLSLDVSKNKKEKKAFLMKEWSNKAVKRGDVLKTTFNYQTLRENGNSSASLVEVSSNRKRWHCVRLFYSTYLLSPVLGDNLYGGRVKTVMGVSVPVNRWSLVTLEPQKLSEELLNMLEVSPGESKIIPVHLHLSQVLLKKYEKDQTDLILTAPVPDFFLWTCQKLGLSLDNVDQLKCKALD